MKLRTDRRGVSEAISFVLIFSLIVTSVALVYAVGAQELTDVRDYERLNNAERAFDVFADNVEDVSQRGAPSRGTEIKLADASLRTEGVARINVTGDYRTGSTDPARDFTTGNITLSPLTFEAGGTGRIRYVGGAVVRDDGEVGDGRMVRPPANVLDEDRTVLTVIQLEPRGSPVVAGSQTVRIRTEQSARDVLVADSGRFDEVTVNVTSLYAPAWAEYFESEGFSCTTLAAPDGDDPGRVSCTKTDVRRLHLVYVKLTTTFE
ncbi:DUF7289 family protein [Halopelagius longus]|uniref:Uncharacterized protein n=1 Tax=Halopelagius longus TaxID=1236180 RepID=A0A1H1BL00_9EURY|nr:hypothetical protein [Halopelagius longus]RDI70821.1 hypothetical protein DWB78_03250 [Halopelagius longus]SDQ52420.1 hypothetical protein SAMN05216278_1838 [Halopelagius longus]